MSPLYASQLISNSPLVQVAPGDAVIATLFNAEMPTAGQASIAVALQPRTISSGPTTIVLQFECANMGAGVFQIQDADVDVAADYDSINFGGATPGQVVAASMNASGVGRVELQVATRFIRVLCVTAASAAVTVRIRQQ